jgi:tyrosyl-tRNA synthetase
MPEHTIAIEDEPLLLTQILKRVGPHLEHVRSDAHGRPGGVKLNGERVSDKALTLEKGTQFVVQIGKRKFARVKLI